MAIVNRSLDASEKNKVFSAVLGGGIAWGTGLTGAVCVVPWPCTFQGAQIAAWGLSGAPSYELAVNRFIVGTGFTTWLLAKGTSNVIAAFGTSGPGAAGGISGMVNVGSGSTLAALLPNDVLTITSAVANTAALNVSVGVVLQPTVDIKYNYGLGF